MTLGSPARLSSVSLPLLALVLSSCGGGDQAAAPAGGGPGGSRPATPLNVRVAAVAVQDVTYEVKAVGSLEAEEVVQVTAEVEGAVTDVLFSEGDRVTPQTVLARIDPERHRLEAEKAEATWKKAVADAERADQDLARRERLAEDQLVAAEELNRSRAETRRMRAEADSTKASKDIALQNLRRAEVRPARPGVINTRSVDSGVWAKLGMTLATLVDTTRLRLRFKVSEAESLRARDGDEVAFRVAALGERDFTARIYHVGEIADPATRQVEVVAWVRNPGVLKPGFFAEVRLATESKKGALVVPESAVQASEKGFVTYVVNGDTAELRPVQIGLRTPQGGIEIVSGLKAGETVVVEGSDRLSNGMLVNAVATPTATAKSPVAGASAPGVVGGR